MTPADEQTPSRPALTSRSDRQRGAERGTLVATPDRGRQSHIYAACLVESHLTLLAVDSRVGQGIEEEFETECVCMNVCFVCLCV